MVAGVALAACHRDSLPATLACCDKSSTMKAMDAGSGLLDAASGAAPAVELVPVPRFRWEEGCARDFKSSGTASRDIAELQRLCAQGMAPISEPVVAAVRGGAAEATFRITAAGACLRAGAVAPSGGISLSLLSPVGEVLASASSTEPLSVAPMDGTVCVREPGPYRAMVRVPALTTEVSSVTIQVWQAKKD
jgi:hypothetical protein